MTDDAAKTAAVSHPQEARPPQPTFIPHPSHSSPPHSSQLIPSRRSPYPIPIPQLHTQPPYPYPPILGPILRPAPPRVPCSSSRVTAFTAYARRAHPPRDTSATAAWERRRTSAPPIVVSEADLNTFTALPVAVRALSVISRLLRIACQSALSTGHCSPPLAAAHHCSLLLTTPRHSSPRTKPTLLRLTSRTSPY